MRNLVQNKPVRSIIALGLLALATLMTPVAQANSVVTTSPAIGSVLSKAPNAVSVTAASSLLPDGNNLSVQDPNQKQVDDGSLTISDTTAIVGLKPLKVSGIYTVSYTLLSATDTPVTGSYTFLFNAPMVNSNPTVAPIPSETSSSLLINTSSSSSAKITVLVFLGLATLVAIFLIWYARLIWVQSRKSRKRRAHERGVK